MLHCLDYNGVDMSSWIEVDSGKIGYDRENWCRRWRQFMRHFFNIDPSYDYNGSKVHWYFQDKKLADTMTTIWTLEEQGYRTSYQSAVRTFFWVDRDYYRQNCREIIQWGERYGCKMPNHEFGWIQMPDDRIEMLFRLRWAGKSYG
jgi:hypothetical protein